MAAPRFFAHLVALAAGMPKATAELLATYCPAADDLQWDYNDGGGVLHDQGWDITGGARASTKASFNLLGGYVEFTMDVSQSKLGVNTNVYSSFPNLTDAGYRGGEDYCDGQGPSQYSPYWCLEQDFIETNGPMKFGSTWHTVEKSNQSHPRGCDHHGCGSEHHFVTSGGGCNRSEEDPEPVIASSRPFKLRASFTEAGNMVVILVQDEEILEILDEDYKHWDGSTPGEVEHAIVKDYMEQKGAVILSSQWTGWVPGEGCPSGTTGASSPAGSKFTIRDLRLHGRIVKGNATRCGPLHDISGAATLKGSIPFLTCSTFVILCLFMNSFN